MFFKKVLPLFSKPDYGIAHFVLLEKNKTFYKILGNYSDQLILEDLQNFKYASWEEVFLQHVIAVRVKNQKEFYKILSIKGDILVCSDEETKFKKSIKWKSGNKLLIEIMFLT